MPWGWAKRGPAEPYLGGSRGTPEEAKVAHAWPKYEAAYLRDRLQYGGGKYGPGGITEAKELVYYDKVSEDYKAEADENLRKEFNDWLQGQHEENELAEANDIRSVYPVGEDLIAQGRPMRRAVYRDGGVPGQQLEEAWKATYWGKKQLTHLPGVREHLREGLLSQNDAEMQMNLLAEHGPQNLEQAWMYFKHWVKGRPVSLDRPLFIQHDVFGQHPYNKGDTSLGRRSDFRHQAPGGDDPPPYQPDPNMFGTAPPSPPAFATPSRPRTATAPPAAPPPAAAAAPPPPAAAAAPPPPPQPAAGAAQPAAGAAPPAAQPPTPPKYNGEKGIGMKDDHYKMVEGGLRRQNNRDNLGRKVRADVIKNNRFPQVDENDDEMGGDAEADDQGNLVRRDPMRIRRRRKLVRRDPRSGSGSGGG